MVWQRLGRTGWIGTAAVVAALAACTPQPPVEPTLKPIARPDTPPAPPPVVAKPTSQKSAMPLTYFNQVQQVQLTQGLSHRDGGRQCTPFTADEIGSAHL